MKGRGWHFEKEVENKVSAWSNHRNTEWDWGSPLEFQLQEQTPQCYLHIALYIRKRKYEYSLSMHALLRTWSPPLPAPCLVNSVMSWALEKRCLLCT